MKEGELDARSRVFGLRICGWDGRVKRVIEIGEV